MPIQRPASPASPQGRISARAMASAPCAPKHAAPRAHKHTARGAPLCWAGLGVALLVAGCAQAPLAPAAPPVPSADTIAAHVAQAQRTAAADLKSLLVLCNPAPATRPAADAVNSGIAAQIARPAPPPGQAFDNLYYVGGAWASAWALTTSNGIVLIDALNNEAEAALLIDGGLRKLGLDPAQIKTLLVTHGHGDHYGGAPYLEQRYQPRVVMSALDWTMTETRLEFASPLWGAPPKRNAARDVAAVDGQTITQGDARITVYLTPGHTLGTLTPVFDLQSNGRTHRALVWGGTAFNFGNDIPRLQAYIAATERMADVARAQSIDVLLSNHPGYDDSVPKLEARRKQGGAAPNPMVIGTEAVVRALGVMGSCAQAQRDRYLLAR